jgi:manganese/iron transport system substrate-binding protein
VATTTIVGDVVSQIGGDHLNLVTLLPAGADPHSFQPTPQDITRVADADLVFINGLGLEEFMEALIENAGGEARVISVSDGIEPLEGSEEHEGEESDPEHEDEDHEHEGQDPHVWTDPNNVQVWAENIAAALSEADPQNSGVYESNGLAYRQQLQELDGWIRTQVAQVPESSRKLVSDHSVFAYFAGRYGFEQIGAVIPSFSTLAEPSARELAALEDSIRSQGVKAIFVGDTVNPSLSQRIAEDTGVQLVSVLTGSLTGPEGHAPTYLDFIRYNVNAITSALK